MRKAIKITRMRGLTLVELLIAATLSILLLTGAVSIFVASKETFNVGEDMARVQESIRYATTRLIRDISQAGYVGCAPSSVENLNGTSTVTVPTTGNMVNLLDFSQVVIGAEGAANSPDSLTLHYARAETAVPVGNATDNAYSADDGDTTAITANASIGTYTAGDIIAISDCQNLMIARLTADPATSALTHTGISTTTAFVSDMSKTLPMAYLMEGVTYQLDVTAQGGGNVSRLMATRLDGAQQVLLDGVEDFQVEYGIDTDLTDSVWVAEQYLDWNQVVASAFQSNVVSVRVTITVNSGEPVDDALGRDPTFRKSSTFTVALRNYGV